MRHPLNWLTRFAFDDESDRTALLGDLAEEYRTRVRPSRGWLAAQLWYSREILAAVVHTSRARMPRPRRTALGADVRLALRRWRHRPGFALTAILTLALGIGATTAIFSIVDAILLRPLPWADPDRLVAIHAVYPERRQNPAAALTWNRGLLSYQAWDALRQEPAFADVATWCRKSPLDTTIGESRTALVQTMEVSSRLLPMLGIQLVHGRFFTELEDAERTDHVLISEETWQRHLGGRADIIGHQIVLGSVSSFGHETKTVVGVIERGFAWDGDAPDVLLPVGNISVPRRRDNGGWLGVAAKLAPMATVAAANAAAVRAIAQQRAKEAITARAVPLLDDVVRGAGRPLWLVFAAAGMLLLIACTNVAGLLLGEGRARRHEIAVRAALGGTRMRVVRQLLIEHALLGAAGAVVGLMVGSWLMRLCVELAPAALPRLDTVGIDGRIAAFALALGVVTVLLFGVAPAASLARTPASRALAEGGRDTTAGRRLGHRLVVGTSMALALVLLAGASLLGETLLRMTSRPLGFDPKNLHVVSFTMTQLPESPAVRNWDPASKLTTLWWLNMSGALERLAALPGVTGVGSARSAPFLGGRTTGQIRPIGRPVAEAVATRLHVIDESYFRAMGSTILRGRGFESRDRIGPAGHALARTPAPAPQITTVISRELERRLFGDNGVGRQIALDDTTLTVIGVVPDARWRKTDDDDLAAFYLIAESYHSAIDTFFVRTSGSAGTVLPAIKRTLESYNPNIVVRSMTSMDGLMARAMAEERFRATLSLMFGGAALVLAAVGLYGLAARRVADRRREIAVRVALGARPVDVRGLVTRDALRTIAIGLVVGLPAAIAASQVTQSFLYGVTPTSIHVFAIATGALTFAALVATILPARRAARIDPMVVLKE